MAGQKWDYKRVRLESLAKAAQLKLRGSHLPSHSFQLQRNFRVGDSAGKKLFAYMLLLLISLFLNVSVFRPLSERCVRGKAAFRAFYSPLDIFASTCLKALK